MKPGPQGVTDESRRHCKRPNVRDDNRCPGSCCRGNDLDRRWQGQREPPGVDRIRWDVNPEPDNQTYDRATHPDRDTECDSLRPHQSLDRLLELGLEDKGMGLDLGLGSEGCGMLRNAPALNVVIARL